jgi:1-acyl-sn-glycerol-3-phosphate acyltransferase
MIWLRSALFNFWFYGLTLVLSLAGLPLRMIAPRLLPALPRLWARGTMAGLRLLCGITWRVTGLEHLPAEGPALIASMHQSAFDTVIWPTLAPRFCYVLKQELMRIPLFGGLLRATGMIPVDRAAGPAAMRALLRDADRAVANQRQIVIFPEGTRVAVGNVVPLQPGVAALAQRARLPVIPVATDSGKCWSRRAFRKQAGVIHIALLPPIAPGLKRDELLTRLRAAFDAGAAALPKDVDNSVGEPL